MAFPIVRLACLALVLQYSTSTAHADAPPGLGGQEVVEVKYRVQEERGVVPEKVREIILSTMDPAERKRGGIVWPEGSIVTDHKLVAAPFGMRFERKIVSVNDMPVAKVSRPAMYPLEEMYVALQDGRCEQANNGPAPTGGGVQGRVTDDAPVAPPRDSWVDVFFGRRGFGMSSPFPAKVAFNVSEDAEGHRVFEFAEPDGQRHRWVVDKDHPSLVRSYAFWDRGAAPDARPFITAACVEEQQVGRQTIPRVIEWQQDAHFGSAGTMANRARIEILSFTLSPDSTRQPSDLLIKWPKGSFVRVQLTGSAPRDVQVETDRQAIE